MSKKRRYFSHAMIGSACLREHGPDNALIAAAKTLEPVYDQMLKRLAEQPAGRIVLSLGWDDPDPAVEAEPTGPGMTPVEMRAALAAAMDEELDAVAEQEILRLADRPDKLRWCYGKCPCCGTTSATVFEINNRFACFRCLTEAERDLLCPWCNGIGQDGCSACKGTGWRYGGTHGN